MKKIIILSLTCLSFFFSSLCAQQKDDGWIRLFDGKSLNGWKVGQNPETFKVENGAIVVDGPQAHLFYDGEVKNHSFKNFEFKAQVMTTPGSNSGIYFHTEYQADGWPAKGYEVQVNNSHTDWRRTGSLYAVQDVKEVLVKDNEWYTEHIIVKGKQVTIKINDKVVVEYSEPDDSKRPEGMSGRKIGAAVLRYRGMIRKAKFIIRMLW